MSKNDIITEIYNNNLFEKMSTYYSSKLGNFKEDFVQYMYLLVCEIPEEKLIELFNNNELNYYLFYVMKAQAFNDNSDFWKLHKGRVKIEYSLDDQNNKEKIGDFYE